MSSDTIYPTTRACVEILGQPKSNYQRSQFISALVDGSVKLHKDALTELEAVAPIVHSEIKALGIQTCNVKLLHLSEAARLAEHLKGPFGHPPSDRQTDLIALALASVGGAKILLTKLDKKRLCKALEAASHVLVKDYPEEESVD